MRPREYVLYRWGDPVQLHYMTSSSISRSNGSSPDLVNQVPPQLGNCIVSGSSIASASCGQFDVHKSHLTIVISIWFPTIRLDLVRSTRSEQPQVKSTTVRTRAYYQQTAYITITEPLKTRFLTFESGYLLSWCFIRPFSVLTCWSSGASGYPNTLVQCAATRIFNNNSRGSFLTHSGTNIARKKGLSCILLLWAMVFTKSMKFPGEFERLQPYELRLTTDVAFLIKQPKVHSPGPLK